MNTMLLPSPIPCDIRLQPPSSFISRMRSPPPKCSAPNSSIVSTCRALQSLLQTSLPSLSSPNPPPRLDSPVNLAPAKTTIKARKNKPTYKVTKPAPKTPVRKRRRALSDDLGPNNDQENAANTTSKPSTPKRQRKYPPTMPLGLDQRDFDALHATPSQHRPHTPFQIQPDTTFTTPSRPLPFALPMRPGAPTTNYPGPNPYAEASSADTTPQDPMETEEDAALTSLILTKLRLKREDWDQCAQRLAQNGGKDSIGERWKMLVAQEDAGVQFARRGNGLRRRGSLAYLLEMEL